MQQHPCFVLALPDTNRANSIAQKAATMTSVRLDHPSGRPWILASMQPHVRLIHAHVQGIAVAVTGQGGPTEQSLRQRLAQANSLHDLAVIQAHYAGSYVTIGANNGTVFVSAPASQTRRVFYTTVNGVPVFSNRADTLANLAELPLDEVAVGLRLLRGLPHPADDAPMWKGITAISGTGYAIGRPTGSVTEHTWWSRPEPRLSRSEGATALRNAIADAVEVRAQANRQVACDLSGGMDSTPLCYFAAQRSSGILARTFFTNDPGGQEDLDWAKKALPSMPGVREHEVFSTDGLPGFYEALYGMGIPLDDVTQAGGSIPRIRHMLLADSKHDINVHLNGLGGDHLLRGVRAWNHTLAKSRPLLAWRRARAEDAPHNISSLSTLRQLLDRRRYEKWCNDVISDAANAIIPPELPRSNDWSVPLTFPSWLSASGRAAVLERLRAEVADVRPLGRDLAGHFDLFTVRQAGRLARSMTLIGDTFGVAYESPLLDDRVVETVLSVRYEERDTPVEWKPLMKEAMRGLLPDAYLQRTTKVGGAAQAVRGYSANYKTIQKLWNDSGIFDLGIIDRRRLEEAAQPSSTSSVPTHIHALINSAIFLQSQQAPTRSPEPVPQEQR